MALGFKESQLKGIWWIEYSQDSLQLKHPKLDGPFLNREDALQAEKEFVQQRLAELNYERSNE